MCKYKMDPVNIVEDTEQTRFCPHRAEQFCPQTDRQTDTEGETFQLCWSGGLHMLTTFFITGKLSYHIPKWLYPKSQWPHIHCVTFTVSLKSFRQAVIKISWTHSTPFTDMDIPAWINKHMQNKMWAKITFLFTNFNSTSVHMLKFGNR